MLQTLYLRCDKRTPCYCSFVDTSFFRQSIDPNKITILLLLLLFTLFWQITNPHPFAHPKTLEIFGPPEPMSSGQERQIKVCHAMLGNDSNDQLSNF